VTRRSIRRITASIALLLGTPSYILCRSGHWCIGGHGAHEPYPVWHVISDAWWILCFAVAIGVSWRSDLRYPRAFSLITAFICLPSFILPFFLSDLLVLIPILMAVEGLGAREATDRKDSR